MKNSKDILIRAIKTFFQTAFGVLLASLATGIDITDAKIVYGILISAIASGLSAVNNLIINVWEKKK